MVRSIKPAELTSGAWSARDPSWVDSIPTWLLITAGVLFVALAENRAAIAPLGWIAPLPLLLAVTRLRGWRGRTIFVGACILAGWLVARKVVTPPVTMGFSLLFGIPIGALLGVSLVIWDALRQRTGPVWAIYLFPCVTVLADYAIFALSPGGDWGALLVNSQLENLPLLQLASIGGLGLIAFVIAWPIGTVAVVLLYGARRRVIPHVVAAFVVLLTAHAWGALRLDAALDHGPTLRVAGVTVDMPDPLTDYNQLRGRSETLFVRSELAAQRGAQLVIWNEIATLIDPAEEPDLRARGAELARRYSVDLVLAYGVLLSSSPLAVDNKYEWLGPDGELVETYRKHFIVPSDPNLKGTEPLRVLDRPWGKAAGALCYDYDSPAIARAHARGGAGVIALPASDWRGIDPYHTLMARVRAIEGGMSVVRPTRAATSMAFDPYGRVRASMSAWEANEHVMLATVPTAHVDTLYTRLGNWPALLSLIACASAVALVMLERMRMARRRSHLHATPA